LLVNQQYRVCRQTQPLQLTHSDKESEAQMLQAVRTIPCSQRIAELNQSGHNWITMKGYLLPKT